MQDEQAGGAGGERRSRTCGEENGVSGSAGSSDGEAARDWRRPPTPPAVSLRERKQDGCPLRVPEEQKGAIAEAYLEDKSWPQADPLAGNVQ